VAKASIKSISGNIQKGLEDMIQKTKSMTRWFLETQVYPTYLRAQMKRWMTEGRSDGFGSLDQWAPLNARYAAIKKVRWAAYPGGGTKMLIASKYLYNAVVGEGPGHKKIVGDRSIIVGVDVPYAKYVNAKRPFFIFSDEMLKGIRDKYKKFISERGGGG